MLAADPAGWPERPLGALMRENRDLREVSQALYNKLNGSGQLNGVSFADFIAVQAARQAAFHKVEAMHALKYPGEKPIVITMHFDMGDNYYLVDPWEPYSLTLLIGKERLAAAGLGCTHEHAFASLPTLKEHAH